MHNIVCEEFTCCIGPRLPASATVVMRTSEALRRSELDALIGHLGSIEAACPVIVARGLTPAVTDWLRGETPETLSAEWTVRLTAQTTQHGNALLSLSWRRR